MTLPWKSACSRPRASLAALSLFGGTATTFGCGGAFPNIYLYSSEAQLLAAPAGTFPDELARIQLASPSRERAAPRPDPQYGWAPNLRSVSADADIAGVREALARHGLSAGRAQELGNTYVRARTQLESWVAAQQLLQKQRELEQELPARQQSVRDAEAAAAAVALPAPVWPADFPAEFAHYFAGAIAWHQGSWADARAAWLEVMALPERERAYRSTWASYMLGRMAAEEAERERNRNIADTGRRRAAAEAQRWCRRTRELAAEGFADPLGFAAASYGWEALASVAVGDYVAAINLYLSQRDTGDVTAVESLRRIAAQAASGAAPEQLQAMAREGNARAVVTAYFVARGRYNFPIDDDRDSDQTRWAVGRWATALANAGVTDAPHADRLAWVAYQSGVLPLAEKWAALAPEDSGIAEWIRGQLALRAGRLSDGETHLTGALATGDLTDEQRRKVLAELGRTCLAQDDAVGALTAWLQGGHDVDADYVAKRVMTLAELRAYVDERPESSIRYTLAQRLLRTGDVEAAEQYFSAQLQPVLRRYVETVRTGFDSSRAAVDRASAFWDAALVMREHGEELLGTEIQADYWPVLVEKRTDAGLVQVRQEARLSGGIFSTTADELARIDALPAAEKNFRHYRYRAAELAWWAASLLPNDTDETAQILATAGGWLKARDAPAAQQFYQALVIRCGNTELGREAARRHWFPPAAAKTGQL